MSWAEWLILFFSGFGFLISFYIWDKTNKKERLVCVIGKDCNKVVKSKYNNFMGIDNTILGMLYFAFVFVVTLVGVWVDFLIYNWFYWGRFLVSGMAALFSGWLTFVQLGILKEYCEYCLASALFSIGIFLAVLMI